MTHIHAVDDGAGVADRIRAAIVRGDFAPEQRLIEADLSRSFSVSRAAVRTALLELANEGLVERVPNRGSRVRAISLDEAIEILEIRRDVEGLCAAKAAEKIAVAEMEEFDEIRKNMLAAVEDGDLPEYSRLNQLLDQRIFDISQHVTARDVLGRLLAKSVRHQYRLWVRPQRARVSVQEHAAIIEAIVARDPEGARRAVAAHLESVMTALRQVS